MHNQNKNIGDINNEYQNLKKNQIFVTRFYIKILLYYTYTSTDRDADKLIYSVYYET